jgi:hypothetical protein
MYKQFLKTKCPTLLQKYKTYKNKLTNILRTTEKAYYTEKIGAFKNDIKNTWKILKSIIKKDNANSSYPNEFIDNNNIKTDKIDIANGFNKFFTSIGPDLAKQIDVNVEKSNIVETMKKHITNSMFLASIEEHEVIDILNNFKNKKSTDHNGISMDILKKTFSAVVKPFTYICNLSFKSGIFPDEMKTAKVVPIYKSEEKEYFTNYRPVSLLSQFSKILEKLFDNRLTQFIEKHQILSDVQYGFRKNRSTSLALVDWFENLTEAIDKKLVTIGVFIDLKKHLTR